MRAPAPSLAPTLWMPTFRCKFCFPFSVLQTCKTPPSLDPTLLMPTSRCKLCLPFSVFPCLHVVRKKSNKPVRNENKTLLLQSLLMPSCAYSRLNFEPQSQPWYHSAELGSSAGQALLYHYLHMLPIRYLPDMRSIGVDTALRMPYQS